MNITSSPFNWLEASIFYSNIKIIQWVAIFKIAERIKDLILKVRLKEEGFLPAIAVGLNDIGGTGLYSSEYIVGSYGINKLDMYHLGWGTLNGTSDFRNPFTFFSDSFEDRPGILNIEGGKIASDSIFSGKMYHLYGISLCNSS